MGGAGALRAGLVAAGVSAVATPLAGALARVTGVVYRPGELEVHTVEVPYLGGKRGLNRAISAQWGCARGSRLRRCRVWRSRAWRRPLSPSPWVWPTTLPV